MAAAAQPMGDGGDVARARVAVKRRPVSRKPDHVALYDADCGLCRWTLAKVLAWDRRSRLRPLALQSAEAAQLLDGLSDEDRMRSWHLVDPGGEVRSAGAALPPLMRLLPAGGPLAAAFACLPRVSERLYSAVAGNRSRLGRLVPRGAVGRATRRIAAREERGPAG